MLGICKIVHPAINNMSTHYYITSLFKAREREREREITESLFA